MKTVLVVEDDQFLRDLTSVKLEQKGLKVVSVNSAENAHKQFQAGNIDVVILDLELPGVQGMQYLDDIKHNPDTQNVPVIVFSNNDDPDVRSKCEKLGSFAFFLKYDTDYEALLEKVNEAVS